MARPRACRLAFRRKLGRTLQALRAQRIAEHRRRTIGGRGYRRLSRIAAARRFERRISARRVRSLAGLRLSFVASTHEQLAGAPP